MKQFYLSKKLPTGGTWQCINLMSLKHPSLMLLQAEAAAGPPVMPRALLLISSLPFCTHLNIMPCHYVFMLSCSARPCSRCTFISDIFGSEPTSPVALSVATAPTDLPSVYIVFLWRLFFPLTSYFTVFSPHCHHLLIRGCWDCWAFSYYLVESLSYDCCEEVQCKVEELKWTVIHVGI